MFCPVCSKDLAVGSEGVLLCLGGHGALVTGKYLDDIEESAPLQVRVADGATDSLHDIVCPHCSKVMVKVDYGGKGIIIDSCVNCHYRWLDGGELSKIKDHKPEIDGEDLLFIFKLDERMREMSRQEAKEANPRLPLQGSYRAGVEGSAWIHGDRSSAHIGGIIGQGLYGIVRGLTQSKTSRILTIGTLAVFGILFYLVFLDAKNIFGY